MLLSVVNNLLKKTECLHLLFIYLQNSLKKYSGLKSDFF